MVSNKILRNMLKMYVQENIEMKSLRWIGFYSKENISPP